MDAWLSVRHHASRLGSKGEKTRKERRDSTDRLVMLGLYSKPDV